MYKYFNEDMSMKEAQNILFSVVEGKTKSEIEEIKRQFSEVWPIIVHNDLKKNEGYMTE